MPVTLPRAQFQIDHTGFTALMQLAIDHSWLQRKGQALTDLWQLCDTPAKKELLFELLRRFHILTLDQIEDLCVKIAHTIGTEWASDPKKTTLVAVSDDAIADGSQMAMQFLKGYFTQSAGWKESSFRNTMGGYDDYLKSNHTYILLDDFTGTGTTILRKIASIRAAIQTRKLTGVDVKVVVLAAMEGAQKQLDSDGIKYYSPIWLKKGIDDFNSKEEAKLKRTIMRDLESSLMTKFNGQFLPRLGYGNAQALFAFGGINCPNNVFPLFWWPKYVDKSDRVTILRRFR